MEEIKRMGEYQRVELLAEDVVGESVKSLADFIYEARKIALKEKIKANTVIIDKTFAKVNNILFVLGGNIMDIPPMICGLEIQLTDELPDGYSFALIEAPETQRERIARHAKEEVAMEIFEELRQKRNELWNKGNYTMFECWCKTEEELEKKYTKGGTE